MNYSRTRLVTAIVVVMLLGGVTASALFRAEPQADQDKPKAQSKDKGKQTDASAALAAIRKTSDRYAEAFNKGDLDDLTSLWTTDAEYINLDGKAFHGRDAISAELKRLLAEAKGSRVSFRSTSLRFPRPDVAVEDGVARTISATGEATSNRYTAVWVKEEDKWLLSSARDFACEAVEKAGPGERLKELAWLLGEWTGEGPRGETRFVCQWAPNQSFLLLDYTIRREGGEVAHVQQRIGWDPVNQSLRSWVFDSSGGFCEGMWTREGNRWKVEAEGTLPDGRGANGVYIYQFVEDGRFTFRARDRQVDGQPVADMEVKFTKKTDKK